ncbi:NUDIX domain-containing protein [Actinomyces faecalis]|uniref:NUDIX domain-containing protein n=1 Tax=Actinomyces faecalis TaxID=2722820 RepID=UPI0015547F73|nr:NUDIX hydrolase [Actinomyces faecalis]
MSQEPGSERLHDVRDSRQVSSSEQVWAGPILTVEDERIVLAPGTEAVRRQTVTHHDAVSVLAWREGEDSSQDDGAPEVLMVRQYRHPVRAGLWEIPAGLLDVVGEAPVVAAARELAEETDHEARTWHTLVDYYASPGFTTEGCRSFLARGLSVLPVEQRVPREAEEAELVPTWFRFDDVVAAVLGGRLHNPATCMAVLAADRLRARGWEGLREADAPWLRSPVSLS